MRKEEGMRDSKILWSLTLLLLIMFVHGALGTEVQGARVSLDSLVSNGGFEIMSGSRPVAWKEGPEGGWGVEMVNSYRGNNSLRATVTESWLSQEIPVIAQRDYSLRGYVRSDITIPENEDYQNTFLTLECLNWRKKIIHREWGIVNSTSSWQIKESRIFTPPGTRKIRIKLAKRKGEGSVWFDEVKVVDLSGGPVLNGGFEIPSSSGKPKFWKNSSQGGWFRDTQRPYEGRRSMRATVAWSFLSQEVPVRAETYYALGAYVKSDIAIPDKADRDNAFLTLECFDGKNEPVKRQWGIVNATSFWELKENLIFTPPAARKIRIKLAKRQGEGSVWFDDVKLMEIPFGSVLNDSFEIISRGEPDYWKQDAKGGWKISEKVVYDGDRAMRANRGWSWLSQDVAVKPKRWYTLEAQIKSDIMLEEKLESNKNTFLTLECLDREGKVIKRQWGIVTAFPLWHKRENRIYTPEETRKIRIKLAKRKGEGSVWFDDVELVERLFLAGKLPERLTPFFNLLMYFLLAFSFLTVVIRIRSRSRSDRS